MVLEVLRDTEAEGTGRCVTGDGLGWLELGSEWERITLRGLIFRL